MLEYFFPTIFIGLSDFLLVDGDDAHGLRMEEAVYKRFGLLPRPQGREKNLQVVEYSLQFKPSALLLCVLLESVFVLVSLQDSLHQLSCIKIILAEFPPQSSIIISFEDNCQ